MADNENPIAKWLREKTGMEPGTKRGKSMTEEAISREERGEEPQPGLPAGTRRDPSERRLKSAIEREEQGLPPEDDGRSGRNAGDLGMSWDETFKKHIG